MLGFQAKKVIDNGLSMLPEARTYFQITDICQSSKFTLALLEKSCVWRPNQV